MAEDWMVEQLVEWVRENARPFAWDDAFEPPTDPYRVLVAELMLTRTNANAAEVVYREFVDRFPTLLSINGSDSDVVRIFSKLGLTARASRMPKLFTQLVNNHRGVVPDTYPELISLHGVGPYVANAVLCFAFGKSLVPVDVNVVRVISRFCGLERSERELQSFLNGLVSTSIDSREFSLSLMEMGAQVCRARDPQCKECPILGQCLYLT